MSSLNVSEQVSRLLEKHFAVTEAKPGHTLVGDLALDSLDIAEFCMALEDEFAVRFTDDDINAVRTVQDCIDTVARKQNVEAIGADTPAQGVVR